MPSDFEIEDCEVSRETEKAILVTAPFFGEDELWVPKSMVTDASDVWDYSDDGRGPGTLRVERWFAKKEDWTNE
jgi:hypothetical protein